MIHWLTTQLHSFRFGVTEGDACNDVDDDNFFFFPPWWKYLGKRYDSIGNCVPDFSFGNDFWLIGLAILEMLLRLVGFVAVVSIIIAGIELIGSEGNSEKGVDARNRIINALKGLAIAIIATGAVTLVGRVIGDDKAAGGDDIKNVFNLVFVVMGALALLFIVIAGLRFVNSKGEPTKIADSRRQITYAALGLIIIASAAAIVNFVLNSIS